MAGKPQNHQTTEGSATIPNWKRWKKKKKEKKVYDFFVWMAVDMVTKTEFFSLSSIFNFLVHIFFQEKEREFPLLIFIVSSCYEHYRRLFYIWIPSIRETTKKIIQDVRCYAIRHGGSKRGLQTQSCASCRLCLQVLSAPFHQGKFPSFIPLPNENRQSNE